MKKLKDIDYAFLPMNLPYTMTPEMVADAAKAEELPLRPLESSVAAPHFVIWIQQLLEQKYGADVLYRSGLQVTTTLDARMQSIAQKEAQKHLKQLSDRHAT